jgi:hypothetical protein
MIQAKQLSIKGTISKKGLLWCASINLIRVTSHGSSPLKCLDAILASVVEISGRDDLGLMARVHDNFEFHVTSSEVDAFLSFIKVRVEMNHDREDVLSRLGEYLSEVD